MVKKDKLYTVNRFNKPMFMGDENIFSGVVPGQSSQMQVWQGLADNWQGYDDSLWDDKTTQYMNSKNAFGISKKNNPFSKGNLAGVGKAVGNAALSAGAGLLGSIGSSAISGGLQSAAGNAIGSIGSTIGGAVGAVNPVAGAVIGVGSQLLGGLANRAFGSKLNEENINTVENNINNITESGNVVGAAQTNEDLLSAAGNMQTGFDFNNDFIGEDGWFSSKAKDKANELRKKQEQARAFAARALTTGAQNADANMDFNVMSNFAANGGPLFMRSSDSLFDEGGRMNKEGSPNVTRYAGLITPSMLGLLGTHPTYPAYPSQESDTTNTSGDYLKTLMLSEAQKRNIHPIGEYNSPLLAGDYYKQATLENEKNRKKVADFNRETNMNSQFSETGPFFAFGGDLQTHGGDFGTGLTHIDTGKSHEENPNDGVQMGVDQEGVPNLVEEGETVYDDYVFSNRILADETTKKLFRLPKKKDITFADISKRLEKEIAERPNDPISEAGFKAQMQSLEEQQERQKQEMEAERAKAAFEALSPEKQTAVMQQVAQQNAMAQQAAMQQPAPEEVAMAEQQAEGSMAGMGMVPQMANGGRLYGDGSKIVKKDNGLIDFENSIFDAGIGDVVITGKKKKKKSEEPAVELPSINATEDEIIDGLNYIENQNNLRNIAEAIRERNAVEDNPEYVPIHYFAKGGLKKNIYKMLPNIYTDEDFKSWVDKANTGRKDARLSYDTLLSLLDNDDYDTLRENDLFWEIATKDNPALAHAIKSGYDFGMRDPINTGKATIQSIGRGNWEATDGEGWFGSDDLAFKQATEGLSNDEIKALTTKQLADRMRDTQAYRNTTEWLKNKDNALQYLRTLVDDKDTPDVAKRHAWQFLEAGNDENNNPYIGWKSDYDYNYDDVFGKVRATDPGTYWHTALEANRENLVKNFVQGENGEWQEVQTDIPKTWKSLANYTWNSADSPYTLTHNYLQKPLASVPETPAEVTTPVPSPETEAGKKQYPKLRDERLRYMGLFGPTVGLGMMAAGVGKPDYGMLDAAVNNAGKAYLASYKPIGNYLRYNPMDIWFEQNRMDANARATDRAIMNNAAPVGTKMAGLLASGYNNQIANGQLYRNALEYNDAKRAQVAEFNRGTDKYNADAFTRNSQFNAAALNDAQGRNLTARLHAASERLNRDAGWYNSLYGNIAGLFRGLGDLGRENAQWNLISRAAADTTDLGTSNTADIYLTDKKKRGTSAAKGGKLKKKKRGLTC